MIKIDLSTFNLICTRNSDGRKFIYKYITKLNLKLIDTVTGEVLELSQAMFRKDYTPDGKANGANRKKPRFINFGRKRVA
jgi:hypothetical protein